MIPQIVYKAIILFYKINRNRGVTEVLLSNHKSTAIYYSERNNTWFQVWDQRLEYGFVWIPTPKFDWESSNLQEQWRKFKSHVELIFDGSLKEKSEEVKVNYLYFG